MQAAKMVSSMVETPNWKNTPPKGRIYPLGLEFTSLQ